MPPNKQIVSSKMHRIKARRQGQRAGKVCGRSDEARERRAALLYLQQRTTVKSNRRVDCGQPVPNAPSCSEPRGADRCVF